MQSWTSATKRFGSVISIVQESSRDRSGGPVYPQLRTYSAAPRNDAMGPIADMVRGGSARTDGFHPL
jgi:hypothetical protein